MLALIVDDDPHFRLFASRTLEKKGFEVVCLASAFGLVNRAAGFDADGERAPQPDVIVLDHMMPGLEGGDSLKLLASDRRTGEIPVVLVSAGPAPLLESLAAAHPRCTFVPKTGRMAPVVDAVENAVAVEVTHASAPAGSRV
jgi:CheY-like chemotaxis protein